MSYDQQFKGKLVWGTPVWRILLETNQVKLKSDFSGTLTLFERRHEKSTAKFTSLQEFVNLTRDLWKESLRSEVVQESRLARWIEEYFDELNISATYQDIFDAIRGDFEEIPPLELGEAEIIPRDRIDQLIPEREDILVSGTTQKIKGDIGDREELNKILENFLIENKPERQTTAKSTSSFRTEDGQERTIEAEKPIQENPLDDGVVLASGFFNDFGVPVEDVEIADTIPYDFHVNDVKLSGVEMEQLSRQKTPEGLEFKWKIERLQPGDRSKIEYELGKRMLRTILIRDDYDLTIMQTYEEIQREDSSVWIDTNYVFQEQTQVVENVKILDQIPGDYHLRESKPEATPPLAQVRISDLSTEVSWSYTDVPSMTQFIVSYELDTSTKIVRDKIQLLNERDELAANIIRILKPLNSEEGYGVIMAVECEQDVDIPLTISDEIPLSYQITKVDIDHGEVAEVQKDTRKEVIWRLQKLSRDDFHRIYLKYIGNERYQFDQVSISSDAKKIAHESSTDRFLRAEKISLPKTYRDNVEA